MPDLVHWLFGLNNVFILTQTTQRFKARSTHGVNCYLKRSGAVWQKAYYDYALRQEEDIQGVARYIIANPLRAGLAHKIGEYPLWDAAWL